MDVQGRQQGVVWGVNWAMRGPWEGLGGEAKRGKQPRAELGGVGGVEFGALDGWGYDEHEWILKRWR